MYRARDRVERDWEICIHKNGVFAARNFDASFQTTPLSQSCDRMQQNYWDCFGLTFEVAHEFNCSVPASVFTDHNFGRRMILSQEL
jgi:hypothetical protein